MSLSNNPQPADLSVINRKPTLKTSSATSNPPVLSTAKRSPAVLGLALLAVLSLSSNVAQYITYNKTPDKYVEKLGKILEKQEQAGAVSYLLELPNGDKSVVYGAKGTKALFYGDAYQADTQDVMFSNMNSKSTVGTNPQNQPQQQSATAQSASANAASSAGAYAEYGQNDLTPGQAIGEFKGKVPDIFPILDALSGFKENASISPANTVYIIYDPRCPYCHQLFEDTRKIDLKAKGATIKWLPTTALGESTDAIAQAAAGMRAKTVDEFAAALGKDAVKAEAVTDKEKQAIKDNFALFYEAHKTAFAGKSTTPSVPAAFFLDKRTGEPRLVYGSSLPEVRKSIFGE